MSTPDATESGRRLPQALANGAGTIPEMIVAAAQIYGDKPAIVSEQGEVISYRTLEARMIEAARAMMAYGIQPGDRVAIWAPNSVEGIVATLGLQTAGAALVPLNSRLRGTEAGHILAASQARILFTVNGFLGVDYPALIQDELLPDLEQTVLFASASSGGAISWEEFLARAEDVSEAQARARLDRVRPHDISDILFTSGTTGKPKGVLTNHEQNLRQYATYSGNLGLHAGDHYLIINPFFHVFGYKAGWLIGLMRGATIYPMAMFDPDAVLRRIETDRISYLPGPPTIFQSLLAADYGSHDLSSLRLTITGAASVPVELVRRMQADLGFDTVLTAYGLTESCGVITMCRAEDDIETIANTAGRPIEGVELRLVDDDGTDVPQGEPGEILVRGYCVMQGYLDQPEETAKAIDTEGWLHTSDVATTDPRGNIRITGRKKDMFIVGGFNCYPAEIENMILAHPDIVESAVIGVPDERLGEVAKAFVVLTSGSNLTNQELITWCRQTMANYKAPRIVEFRDSLPKNAAGKIDKELLRRDQKQ